MDRAALEAQIRERADATDIDGALQIAFEGYGPEIGSYLGSLLRDDDAAADVFQMFAEDVCQGLASFRFQASFRTWAYTLARNAAVRFRKDPRKRPARNVPISAAGLVSRLAEEARFSTAEYRKTAVKDRVRALRDELDDEERELLVLRVDRDLTWNEIAAVVAPDEDEAARKRTAAALRKRFERAKERLKERARATGLLDGGSG